MTRAVPLILLSVALAGECAAAEGLGAKSAVPDAATAFRTATEAAWALTPVEILAPARARKVLNGLWRFRAGRSGSSTSGWLRVPGTWGFADWPRWNLEGPLAATGTPWEAPDWRGLAAGRYEREVTVPREWKSRRIVLRVVRPSAQATVYVDGVEAGGIAWPGGELDITDRVLPGRTAALGLLVTASSTAADVEARGLAGDVILESRPAGARLDGVFIRTSVRARSLVLEVDLADVAAAGTVRFTAEIRGPKTDPSAKPAASAGQPARVFTGDAAVAAVSAQTVRLEWEWRDPILWEAGRPFLYTLRLRAEGPGFTDELNDRFGFREFRIEGRDFLLNEHPIRLRPFVWLDEAEVAGARDCIGRVSEGLLGTGYNLLELWPTDHATPGRVHFRELWADAADERGLLLMYPALSLDSYIGWDGGTDRAWGAWEAAMVREWKTIRNHPSVVILVSTANRFGYTDDLNPLRLGNSRTLAMASRRAGDEVGRRLIETIRRHDSTRPLTSHEGGAVGDFQAANCYLDLIPLQEREEWLSAWEQHGDRPVMAVEFGTPLSCTFQRGRCAYGENRVSEPLMTEFCAIYFGTDAYRLEPASYRAMIAAKFRHDQVYDWVSGGRDEFDYHPAHQRLQALFNRQTWRSWRGWGMAGGMIPWEWGHGFRWPGGTFAAAPPEPGRTGSWTPSVKKAGCLGFRPGGLEPTEAGRALFEVSRPQLAWLAGPQDAWPAKDHLFGAGETVHKTLAMANDGPAAAGVEVSWIVDIGPGRIAWGKKGESVPAARTLFLPIDFEMPAAVAGMVSGTIFLEISAGGEVTRDAFPVRVFPPVRRPADRPEVLLFDPEGATKDWIERLGWKTRRWDGGNAPGRILVVGRHALDRGTRLPGSLAAFAETGGRLILMGQDPEWLRRRAGFRVARHVSRRAFPVPSPGFAGLTADVDGETLRDWRGAGTLVPATADVALDRGDEGSPPYGWHWGNRGSVTSAAIEKPHRSGWTPILEAEFDLAYTPLMELAVGEGLAIWCTLDLEGRVGSEPAADLLASRLLEHARAVPARPRAAQTVYLGGAPGEALLRNVGLRFTRTFRTDRAPGLLVVAADAPLTRVDLDRRLAAGWRLLLLPRPAGDLPFAFRAAGTTGFAGSLDVPAWPECRGLSASDLRLRAPVAATVLIDGPEVGAGGLLGRVTSRFGSAILIQLTPDQLEADRLTYLRYSSWRLTRTLAQLLANLGGEFEVDRRSLDWGRKAAGRPASRQDSWMALIGRPARPESAVRQAPPDAESGGGDEGGGGPPDFYVPGLRTDFVLGDDPYRYYRW
ncbi:MAG: beta-galactosidase [Candidatus Coatesbacteria bacterium]